MSSRNQTLSALLHGEALLRARRREFDPLIAELTEVSAGRDDLRAECAGTIAGAWFASPGTAYGHDLIAAGLLILAGPIDRQLLIRWVKIGYGRRVGTTRSYDPSRPTDR